MSGQRYLSPFSSAWNFTIALVLIMAGFALSSCQFIPISPIPATNTTTASPIVPTWTPTPVPTHTPTIWTWTPTLMPTHTPAATPTPRPTDTPIATPSPTTPPTASPTQVAIPTVMYEMRLGSLPAIGRFPEGIVRVGESLYVTSREDDRVLVIEDDRVTAGIPVGDAPAAVAADAELGLVYVACEGDQTVYVIREREITAQWELPYPPRALAVAGGRLYVGFDGAQGMDVLDAQTGVLQSHIPTSDIYGVFALAVDEAARRLYVAGYERTLIVDLADNRVMDSHQFHSYITLAVDLPRSRWYTNDYDGATNTQWLVAVEAETGKEVGRVPLGGDPRQALVHPTEARIYVANSWSNTVSVIDAGRLEVIATILVGRRPTGLCLDDTGRRLYVTNTESHNLAVIDLATHEMAASIPLAMPPADIELDSARGYLYALVPASNVLAVLQGDRVVQEVSLGIDPTDMAVDQNTGTVYVSHYAGGNLSVITPGTWKVQSLILSQQPVAVAVDSARRRAYAGNEIISTEALSIQNRFELKAATITGMEIKPVQTEVDPLTHRLFIVAHNGIPGSNGGYIIYVLDGESGEHIQAGLGGLSTTAMLLDSQGRRLYSTAGRFGRYTLYVDDVDTLQPIADRPCAGMPLALAYIPANHHLYIGLESISPVTSERQWELSIVDTRTLGELARWPLDEQPLRMVADPATARVYVALGAAGRILVIQDAPMPPAPAPTPTFTPSPWPTWTPSKSG